MTKKEKEISGGELSDLPNANYKKFFDKFSEIENLKIEEWKPVHLIGYFVKKYKSTYKVDYKFKFNSPAPSKCFEVFQIKKLAMQLSSDPIILKNYIDWVYETKVVQAKRRLTSISFMTAEAIVSEYKLSVLLIDDKKETIDRTTPLPNKYLDLIKSMGAATYGDLAFIYQMRHQTMSNDIVNTFDELEKRGLNISMLEKIV